MIEASGFSGNSFEHTVVQALRTFRIAARKIIWLGFLALVQILLLCPSSNGQANEWVWMNGLKIPAAPVYGTLGVAAPGNMPGNRELAISWTDHSGNFWLYGGDGFDSTQHVAYLNDLWKYSPSTNEWAWINGSDTGAGAAGAYGTLGTPSSGNEPPGRQASASWVDASGNLWLFGGYSYANPSENSGYFNDLWEYSPGTNQWTWMGGSSVDVDQGGVYGTLGVPATGNIPGARSQAVSWTDNQGNFWMFGGEGYDANASYGYLNDLWKYTPSTHQWTWMGGSSTVSCAGCGRPGVYGQQGVASSANIPGARFEAVGWTDANGNLWLFGGLGFDSAGTLALLNDLWEFSPSTNQWTWEGGSSLWPAACSGKLAAECGEPGVYGTLQTPGAANLPGARTSPATWTDKKGNLWLFGGDGIDSGGTWGYLNDLWELNPTTKQWTWISGSNTVVCGDIYCGESGNYGTEGTPAMGNVPPGRNNAVSWTDTNGNLWLFAGTGENAVGDWGYFQDLWEFQPNTNGQPVASTPTFSPPPGNYTSTQSVLIQDSTPGATITYTVNGNPPETQYTVPLSLSSSTSITAIASAAGYANSNIASASYTFTIPSASPPVFSPASGTYSSAQTVTISDATPGTTIYYTTDGTLPTTSSSVYAAPITVSSSEVVTAVASASGYLTSNSSSAIYTIGSGSSLAEWSWQAGSPTPQNGVYGALRIPASGNLPGSRHGSTTWTDQAGNLWLFGGEGYDANGNYGYLNDLWEFTPATGLWEWVGGSNTMLCNLPGGTVCGAAASYGPLQSPAAGNSPGGRYQSVGWSDGSGHLWLFGGYGLDSTNRAGELNDLWEFDLSTNEWTWVGGSNTETLSFYSSLGQPGVYGSLGVPAPANIPGSRYDAAAWKDNQGNFWIFGGTGEDAFGDSVTLNDFWKYDPSKNEWTWMGGANFVNPDTMYHAGVYGTIGVPSSINIPPSRAGAATWTDHTGNLWLFGGDGGRANGKYNDLWKYDPSSNEWTWMSGTAGPYCTPDPLVGYSACSSPPGVFGALGVPASANTPGGGSELSSWVDQSGNLWLLGGWQSDITGQNDGFYLGNTNALWVYSPSMDQWTWMGGDYRTSNCSEVIAIPLPLVICDGSQGVQGTQGIPGSANAPASRTQAASWTDKNGNLWLFSGQRRMLSETPYVDANDLWKYQPSLATLPAATMPIFSLEPGTYTSGGPLLLSNGMPDASIYYTVDGTTPTTASTLYTGPINIQFTGTVQAIAVAPGYRNSGVASATYTFPTAPPPPSFSLPAGTYNSVQTLTLSDASPGAQIFYTTDGSDPASGATDLSYTAPITIPGSEVINARALLTGYYVWDGIAADYGPYVYSSEAGAAYTLDLPPAAAPAFNPPGGTYTSAQTLTITDATPGATIRYTLDGSTPTTSSTIYAAPIQVSSSETVNAIASAYGYSTSGVATAQYTLNLAPPDFSIAASAQSMSLNAGQSGSLSITVTPQNGFNSTVSFTCAGLPAGATCTFSPGVVLPSGGPASTTVTITTPSSLALEQTARPLFPCALLGVLLFGIGWRKKFGKISGILLVFIAAMLLSVIGCGGGGSVSPAPPTSPVTTTITITASSGSLVHTTTFSLTVN